MFKIIIKEIIILIKKEINKQMNKRINKKPRKKKVEWIENIKIININGNNNYYY